MFEAVCPTPVRPLSVRMRMTYPPPMKYESMSSILTSGPFLDARVCMGEPGPVVAPELYAVAFRVGDIG